MDPQDLLSAFPPSLSGQELVNKLKRHPDFYAAIKSAVRDTDIDAWENESAPSSNEAWRFLRGCPSLHEVIKRDMEERASKRCAELEKEIGMKDQKLNEQESKLEIFRAHNEVIEMKMHAMHEKLAAANAHGDRSEKRENFLENAFTQLANANAALIDYKDNPPRRETSTQLENPLNDVEARWSIILLGIEARQRQLGSTRFDAQYINKLITALVPLFKDINRLYGTDFRYPLPSTAEGAANHNAIREQVSQYIMERGFFTEIHGPNSPNLFFMPTDVLSHVIFRAQACGYDNLKNSLPPKKVVPETSLCYNFKITGKNGGAIKYQLNVDDGRIRLFQTLSLDELRHLAKEFLVLAQLIIDEVGWTGVTKEPAPVPYHPVPDVSSDVLTKNLEAMVASSPTSIPSAHVPAQQVPAAILSPHVSAPQTPTANEATSAPTSMSVAPALIQQTPVKNETTPLPKSGGKASEDSMGDTKMSGFSPVGP